MTKDKISSYLIKLLLFQINFITRSSHLTFPHVYVIYKKIQLKFHLVYQNNSALKNT